MAAKIGPLAEGLVQWPGGNLAIIIIFRQLSTVGMHSDTTKYARE